MLDGVEFMCYYIGAETNRIPGRCVFSKAAVGFPQSYIAGTAPSVSSDLASLAVRLSNGSATCGGRFALKNL